MKKQVLAVLTIAMFLVIPVSVYAYSNDLFDNGVTNNSTHYNHHMTSVNHMPEMMIGHNMEVCTDPEQHDQFIQEQKLKIEKELENQEITQEKANELFNDLDQMLQFHETHHQNNTVINKCDFTQLNIE